MEKRSKIVMLDPANLTPFYNYSLAEALNKDEQCVKIMSTKYLQDPNLKAPAKVKVVDFYFQFLRKAQAEKSQKVRQIIRGLSYPFDHLRLLKQFEKDKPEILHIQWSMLPALDLWLVNKAKALGVKVVHTVHDVTPLFDMGKHKRLERLFQAVDALIVHSRESAESFAERYPQVDSKKVHVIAHGPLQNEDSEAHTTEDARRSLGIPVDAGVALFFGEIKHYKGLHQLVECFPDVSKALDNAFLLVAGRPDSPETEPDVKLLEREGVSYKADLGFVPNDDVWKYYHAADIVVLPYINISQSGVLFSALANAKPVVTTKVGGLPEIVDATSGGWVVPPGSKDDLAQAIVEALKDREATKQMGLIGKDKLMSLYGWDSIADKTHSLYESLR